MATKRWIGGATAVPQVDTLTVGGTIEAGDKFKITVTGEDGSTYTLSVSASGTTIAGTCTDIANAWNASANPLLTPITALAGSTTVTLTADSGGVPFVVSATTTESDNSSADAQTFSRAATTANVGPSDWNSVNNWSDFAVPVSTDTVVIDGRSTSDILYGLNQSAVTLTALQVIRGSPNVGTTIAALRISATTLEINVDPAEGGNATAASCINIDTGTNATTGTIFDSASQGTDGLESVIWKGVEATNIIRVRGGKVGIATSKPGDAATLATLQLLGQDSNTSVHIGAGVTLTTLTQQTGDVKLECAVTTINQDGGALTTEGTGTITTAYISGVFKSNSTGTITNLHVEPGGLADFTGSTAARTVTNAAITGDGKINAALPTVSGAAHAITFSTGVDCIRGAKSGQVDFGGDITVTPSAV